MGAAGHAIHAVQHKAALKLDSLKNAGWLIIHCSETTTSSCTHSRVRVYKESQTGSTITRDHMINHNLLHSLIMLCPCRHHAGSSVHYHWSQAVIGYCWYHPQFEHPRRPHIICCNQVDGSSWVQFAAAPQGPFGPQAPVPAIWSAGECGHADICSEHGYWRLWVLHHRYGVLYGSAAANDEGWLDSTILHVCC